MRKINVAVIGHKFMGRAHTHAYTDIPMFFNPEFEVVKKVLCAHESDIESLARMWGFESITKDFLSIINDDSIDVIDIAAPSSIHAKVAIAAAQSGKHILCEKPLALTIDEAYRMVEAVEKAGVVNMISFNYRRVPAIAFAKQLLDSGALGEIYHFRGVYQQDWLVNPNFPLAWRLRKSAAGYGSHGDLGAHVVDIARYLVGDIEEVVCMQKTFITKRPMPIVENGLTAIAGTEIGDVDVDDASAFLAKFKDCNAICYIEATRYGTGHRNQNRIEINGSKGSIIFDMDKMNELEYYNAEHPSGRQGFQRIQVTESIHPYMENWWPAGHIIGYGDTFVNQAFDFLNAVANNEKVKPDFMDGLKCQQILEAANISAQTGKWQKVQI